MLFFDRWLLSGDLESNQILESQTIIVIPLISPHQYYARVPEGNAYGGWNWSSDGSDPEKQPEAIAYEKAIDTWLPEVHLDLHGFNDNAKGLEFACSMNHRGTAGGCGRSFLPELPRLMDKAAEAFWDPCRLWRRG